MKKKYEYIKPEDYAEPRCLLCGEPYGAKPSVKPVPQMRIIEKINDYMSRRDYNGVERHLSYWLEEAKLGGDKKGELMIRNEFVGHYRKTGNKEKAFENGDAALKLLKELNMENSISAGTTYTNIATAYNAFGRNGDALSLFEKFYCHVHPYLPENAHHSLVSFDSENKCPPKDNLMRGLRVARRLRMELQ